MFSAASRKNLNEIALFIARDSKPHARSFVRDLRARARDIGTMPYAFPLVPGHEHTGVRRRVYRNYLIFYVVEDEQVAILNILHGAQNHQQILFPE